MRLLERCSTLYTGSAFRVSVIGAKLMCLSITSKQARVAPECCHAVQGLRWRCPLTLIAKGIVVVYLDNILIFTKTEEEYERVVQRVLEILAEHKLFLRLEKYEFHQRQIEYLRLVISENKVAMNLVKVTRVHEWPTLENQTDMQAFIGFVNFYH